MAGEIELAAILCAFVFGGKAEQAHHYVASGQDHYIKVDCETDTHVIEVGLDNKRGSFDSVHQAVFAAYLTGKAPMVVIIDTNGREESQEFQIETVAQSFGVAYETWTEDELVRMQMTWPFRVEKPAPYIIGAALN
ncbi:hypothetical protein [Flavimaricola marinus]|uniref:Uncharacterized protein n=1 Tax=Flavimaricola marinus TaxID=1819565 RepID=A0A238LDF1_9RHOB|nr:hypothetical protein [Flavimaricola marinus]SMY07699.1 hypothetical protein LOM8899_01839 [Flavimaricola marinus]